MYRPAPLPPAACAASDLRQGAVMTAVRRVLVCLGCFLVVLVALPVIAVGEEEPSASSLSAQEAGASSGLGAGLVISGSPTEGEEVGAQEEARLSSPEVVAARVRSRTEFKHLGWAAAEKVASETFPALVNEPAGGPPRLPAGTTATGFVTDDAESVDLPGGEHGVIESLGPIAKETSPGHRIALDLTPHETGGGFTPTDGLVGVYMPKRIGSGVLLSEVGVSLTPVDEHGVSSEGAEGVVDGASVFYGDTEDANADVKDVDTLVKPETNGFEEETLLRSEESPSTLHYKVGMPEGGILMQARGSGYAQIVDDGQTLAVIPSPRATDAEGASVPVSMTVNGDTLSLSVGEMAGGSRYPVAVDPTVVDHFFYDGAEHTNWASDTDNPSAFDVSLEHRSIEHPYGGEPYNKEQYAFFDYYTQGQSHIYEFNTKVFYSFPEKSETEVALALASSGTGGEGTTEVIRGWERDSTGEEVEAHVCSGPCESKAVTEANKSNEAYFEVRGVAEGKTPFTYGMEEPDTVSITQEKGATDRVDTTDMTIEGEPNAAAAGTWISLAVHPSAVLGIDAFDPGIGIKRVGIKASTTSEWGWSPREIPQTECAGVQCNECFESECPTTKAHGKIITLPFTELGELPEGENVAEATVEDAVGLGQEAVAGVNVDNKPPHNLVVKGLPPGNEIGERGYTLTGEATDGTGSTRSSGVKSIALLIDGRELGKFGGSCTPGPCTGKAEWTLIGGELAVGEHKLEIVATDNAGNVATETITLQKVHHASSVPVGPGSVNALTGEFGLGATDVSISTPGSSLTVTRQYQSRHLEAGAEGPLGPRWSLSIGGQESITKLPTGSVILTSANGGETTFASSGKGGFTAPNGDSSLSLSETTNEKAETTEYILADTANHTKTRFTSLSGPTGSLWKPTKQEGPVASQTVRYIYQAVEGVTEPKYALAPEPNGLSTSCISTLEKSESLEKLEKGCRVLEFKYGTSTTAGEKESEWGEYKGRLKQIVFEAENPLSKAMGTPIAIAEYRYDKQGRLRAVWDPRIEHPLKTIYGYDAEGHVTALTPPGEESWIFTYGTSTSDANTGRLLKVDRASATTVLWNGNVVEDTEAPKLSGIPAVGVRVDVSNGTWSNKPIAYGYQWEDCNSSGKECSPILGATNPNYTPVSGDVGHTLVANVTATNGGGSAVASSAASAVVIAKVAHKTQTVDSGYGLNAISCIPSTTDCVTSDSAGKALYSTNVSSASEATWNTWSGPSGESPSQAVDCPTTSLCLLADGKESTGGNLYYASSLGGAWHEAYTPVYGVDAISCTSSSLCISGQDKEGYFRYATNPASSEWTLKEKTFAAIKNVFCFSSSFCTMVNSEGEVLAATSTSNIESNVGWIATGVDGSTAMNGISCVSTISCIAVDGGGNVIDLTIGSEGEATASKHDIDGTTSLNAISCIGSSICATVDSSGNIFITQNGGASWTKEYSLGDDLTSVSCPSSTLCVTVDTTGKVTGFVPGGEGSEGEARSPQPGTTIEYGVPASGEGAPYSLGKETVEKWGQKDDPVEGIAVFPPNEPQGWPASGHEGATITYLDAQGRVVNAAGPTGGISVNEYNTYDDVVRTLSPDNRATAAAAGEKSKEIAKELSTESTYNESGSEPGTELLTTLGPKHKVKLASGTQTEARTHTVYSYNEGAPATGGPFHLVTKTMQGAELTGGEEVDIRTSTSSYSGQEDLGWKLREPTSTATDPAGLDLVHKTLYEKSTGNVIETRTPGGNSESVYPPTYSGLFGSEGSGEGQFQRPESIAIDSSGDLWIPDKNNGRLEKLSSTGTFIAAYGSKGKGNDQFENPWAIAINNSTKDIYVADTNNSRIEELTTSGEFVRTFGTEGSGKLEYPEGVAIDSAGDVWVSDTEHNRIVEFSATGGFVREFGTSGSGPGEFDEPRMIAISEGSLYVDDYGNSRIEMFSLASGSYEGQFGSSGSSSGQFDKPEGIAVNPNNDAIYVSDTWNHRIQEFSPAGKFLTAWETWATGREIASPTGIAINATGELYIVDQYADKVSEWLSPEAGGAHLNFSAQFGSKGPGNGEFNEPIGVALDGSGDVWVSDASNDRIEKFGLDGKFIAAYGKEGSGEDEFNAPSGIAINKSTGDVYVADLENNRIEELSSSGTYITSFGTSGSGKLKEPWYVALDSSGNVWVTDHGNDRIVEFSSTGTFIAAYGKEGTGENEFKGPAGIVVSGEDVYIADGGNHRVEELTTKGAYVRVFGTEGSGSGEFHDPEGIAADASGNLYVTDFYEGDIEEFSPTGVYKATFGSYGTGEGQLDGPDADIIDSAGDLYVVSQDDDTIEKWDDNTQTAHDTKTAYYTAKEESSVVTCRNHPEWANLPCQTELAAQPDHGLPELPTSTVEYNIWDEPETTEEAVGSTKRTKTETYDSAGRLRTSAVSSSVGTAVPTVTDEYSTETGALVKQCANEGKPCSEGHPKTVSSTYNTLGELTSYTDASESTTTYEYEGEGSYKGEKELDARLRHVNDGKGTETYTYNGTTGLLSELVNEYGTRKLAFTASYDSEGNMLTEGYPNGMTATYTYNQIAAPTSLVYKKTTHCTEEEKEKCVWFRDVVVPSIHGQWLEQTSTLSHEAYTYDAAGRLTQVQDTPTGKGCITRIYGYDEDTNRTSLTTREPNSKGECATEGGTVERHTYDEADRLMDEGTTYNTFGDITSLPASDAGGKEASESLTSTYYTDNQVASQTQNGQTIGFTLDPAGRTIEDNGTGTKTYATTLHYAGSGNAPAWTSNSSGETSRNITGINGQLAAIQNNSEEPELQLANLHGDIVGKAYLSETATGLASTADTTEFGVPTTSLPSKYSWLGALELPTELPSGVTEMGARSYVPELGRFLQPDPIPGGSANAYTYTFGDPIDTSDPSGEYTATIDAFAIQQVSDETQRASEARAAEIKIEEEIAAARAAEEAAARAAAEAATLNYYLSIATGGPQFYGGEEEWGEEEWWEEEGEWEYASYKQEKEAEQENSFGAGIRSTIADTTEGHAGDAVLNQVSEGQEQGEKELAPEVQCGGSREGPSIFDAGSRPGHRENVLECRPGEHPRRKHPQRDPGAKPLPPPLVCPEGKRPSVDPRGYPYCAPEGDGGQDEWGPEDTPEDAP